MKKIFLLLTSFFLLCITYHETRADSDLEVLRKTFVAALLEPGVNRIEVEKLMNSIKEDGTWSDINYEDVSRTGFQHGEHLSHLVEMSRAYKRDGSKLRGNKKLKKAIDLALNYWLANDFICDNWWWNQIGTPNAMVAVLLIMDKDLTTEQVAKTLAIVGRANLNASGARPSGDRIKIAGILARKLLFERDGVQFNRVIKVIEGEIKFSTGRGMQNDYSFHHRVDRVNNTLSYGTDYADVFAAWAANVSGTKYRFSDSAIHELIDYYLDGICKMLVYGKYPDPGAKNRAITRRGALAAYNPITPERLLKASNYRKSELEHVVSIRKGNSEPPWSFSRFYWESEHFTFQRPQFFTSVRMYSDRDYNMEEPYNGEGLMNHYRGDGTNYISRSGREYYGIAPVYDWQKIPGATVMQRPEMPPESEIQKKGLTSFVGAVTDGKYGAVGFNFKSPHDPLEAKKAWFFFDDKYVCLGSGISSGSRLPVVTTLNQCLLKGDVVVMSSNQRLIMKKGEHVLDNVKWIWHDSIGYFFIHPAEVNISNQAQTGSWYRINHQKDSPKDSISMDVFKLWLNHGIHPDTGTYQYIVVPSTTEQGLIQEVETPDITILKNTSEIQAVRNTRLNICEAVFYTSGDIQVSDSLKLAMDGPGIVMIKTRGDSVNSISVEDPSRKLAKIHLSVSAKIEKQGNNFMATWDMVNKVSHISIDLPQTVYAGKSVTIDF